jgi:aspartate/methionine/tyrosine aminotransferase
MCRSSQGRVKMCVLVNPCNPTGILYSHTLLQEARAVCEQAHCWLVVDNTYEHFTYGSAESYAHSCVEGPNVVNVFSFSKAFGMMGWRVG